MIKIFCDTSDINTIKKCLKLYNIKGVTTNPSIMRSDGIRNYKSHCLKILKITKKKPLSVEVFADSTKEILNQANKISTWNKNLYVKIPIVNTKGKILTSIIKKLNNSNVKLNITAVFAFSQVIKIKNSINKKTPTIISIFCGRIADNGMDPEIIVRKTVKLFKNYKNVEILWASTREVYNYYHAKKNKCHIITMAPKFIEKLNVKKISLKKYSMNTVSQFYSDGRKSGFKI